MFYTGMLAGAAYGGLMSQEGGWRGTLKGAALGGVAGRYGTRALQKARLPSMIGQNMTQRGIAGIRSAGRLAKYDALRLQKQAMGTNIFGPRLAGNRGVKL